MPRQDTTNVSRVRIRNLARMAFGVCLGASLLAQGQGGRGPSEQATTSGQAATMLSDGRLLLTGGVGPRGSLDTVAVTEPLRGSTTTLRETLSTARAWHSATVLSDGRVLLFGGLDRNGTIVGSVEIYDPEARVFTSHGTDLAARAGHTATLLSDGRVVLAGGRGPDGHLSSVVELWDPATGSVTEVPSRALPRIGHRATLLSDGAVLIDGGVDGRGQPVASEMVFPEQPMVVPAVGVAEHVGDPVFAGSDPLDGAVDVGVTPLVVVRFSGPVPLAHGAARAFSMSAGSAAVPIDIVAAESGRIFFVRPRRGLEPGTRHTLTVGPFATGTTTPIVGATITFTTAPGDRDPHVSDPDDGDLWIPSANDASLWETGRPPSSWESLPPLQASAGVTALAGRILTLNGKPLAGVQVSLASARARTDKTGRFLLDSVLPGRQELVVDARPASRPGKRYGFFMIAVDVGEKGTTALPYTIWMPVLDTAHAITLPAGGGAFVARTPRIPGLEVHLPAGAVLRDADGQIVRSMTITPIPIDRPPFPLPAGVRFPVYFTLQPGGARLEGSSAAWAQGIRLVFPNAARQRPGTRIDFWSYDSTGVGWFRYGQGTVGADGRTIVPDTGVVIRHFTCASIGTPGNFPGTGPAPGGGPADGDPVDLATGLFVYEKTDLAMPDVLPVALVRTYRQGDAVSRPFGIGTTHNYELHLVGDRVAYTYAELVLPDGGRVRYDRTSAGTAHTTAVMEHTATPTRFQHSILSWNWVRWWGSRIPWRSRPH